MNNFSTSVKRVEKRPKHGLAFLEPEPQLKPDPKRVPGDIKFASFFADIANPSTLLDLDGADTSRRSPMSALPPGSQSARPSPSSSSSSAVALHSSLSNEPLTTRTPRNWDATSVLSSALSSRKPGTFLSRDESNLITGNQGDENLLKSHQNELGNLYLSSSPPVDRVSQSVGSPPVLDPSTIIPPSLAELFPNTLVGQLHQEMLDERREAIAKRVTGRSEVGKGRPIKNESKDQSSTPQEDGLGASLSSGTKRVKDEVTLQVGIGLPGHPKSREGKLNRAGTDGKRITIPSTGKNRQARGGRGIGGQEDGTDELLASKHALTASLAPLAAVVAAQRLDQLREGKKAKHDVFKSTHALAMNTNNITYNNTVMDELGQPSLSSLAISTTTTTAMSGNPNYGHPGHTPIDPDGDTRALLNTFATSTTSGGLDSMTTTGSREVDYSDPYLYSIGPGQDSGRRALEEEVQRAKSKNQSMLHLTPQPQGPRQSKSSSTPRDSDGGIDKLRLSLGGPAKDLGLGGAGFVSYEETPLQAPEGRPFIGREESSKMEGLEGQDKGIPRAMTGKSNRFTQKPTAADSNPVGVPRLSTNRGTNAMSMSGNNTSNNSNSSNNNSNNTNATGHDIGQKVTVLSPDGSDRTILSDTTKTSPIIKSRNMSLTMVTAHDVRLKEKMKQLQRLRKQHEQEERLKEEAERQALADVDGDLISDMTEDDDEGEKQNMKKDNDHDEDEDEDDEEHNGDYGKKGQLQISTPSVNQDHPFSSTLSTLSLNTPGATLKQLSPTGGPSPTSLPDQVQHLLQTIASLPAMLRTIAAAVSTASTKQKELLQLVEVTEGKGAVLSKRHRILGTSGVSTPLASASTPGPSGGPRVSVIDGAGIGGSLSSGSGVAGGTHGLHGSYGDAGRLVKLHQELKNHIDAIIPTAVTKALQVAHDLPALADALVTHLHATTSNQGRLSVSNFSGDGSSPSEVLNGDKPYGTNEKRRRQRKRGSKSSAFRLGVNHGMAPIHEEDINPLQTSTEKGDGGEDDGDDAMTISDSDPLNEGDDVVSNGEGDEDVDFDGDNDGDSDSDINKTKLTKDDDSGSEGGVLRSGTKEASLVARCKSLDADSMRLLTSLTTKLEMDMGYLDSNDNLSEKMMTDVKDAIIKAVLSCASNGTQPIDDMVDRQGTTSRLSSTALGTIERALVRLVEAQSTKSLAVKGRLESHKGDIMKALKAVQATEKARTELMDLMTGRLRRIAQQKKNVEKVVKGNGLEANTLTSPMAPLSASGEGERVAKGGDLSNRLRSRLKVTTKSLAEATKASATLSKQMSDLQDLYTTSQIRLARANAEVLTLTNKLGAVLARSGNVEGGGGGSDLGSPQDIVYKTTSRTEEGRLSEASIVLLRKLTHYYNKDMISLSSSQGTLSTAGSPGQSHTHLSILLPSQPPSRSLTPAVKSSSGRSTPQPMSLPTSTASAATSLSLSGHGQISIPASVVVDSPFNVSLLLDAPYTRDDVAAASLLLSTAPYESSYLTVRKQLKAIVNTLHTIVEKYTNTSSSTSSSGGSNTSSSTSVSVPSLVQVALSNFLPTSSSSSNGVSGHGGYMADANEMMTTPLSLSSSSSSLASTSTPLVSSSSSSNLLTLPGIARSAHPTPSNSRPVTGNPRNASHHPGVSGSTIPNSGSNFSNAYLISSSSSSSPTPLHLPHPSSMVISGSPLAFQIPLKLLAGLILEFDATITLLRNREYDAMVSAKQMAAAQQEVQNVRLEAVAMRAQTKVAQQKQQEYEQAFVAARKIATQTRKKVEETTMALNKVKEELEREREAHHKSKAQMTESSSVLSKKVKELEGSLILARETAELERKRAAQMLRRLHHSVVPTGDDVMAGLGLDDMETSLTSRSNRRSGEGSTTFQQDRQQTDEMDERANLRSERRRTPMDALNKLPKDGEPSPPANMMMHRRGSMLMRTDPETDQRLKIAEMQAKLMATPVTRKTSDSPIALFTDALVKADSLPGLTPQKDRNSGTFSPVSRRLSGGRGTEASPPSSALSPLAVPALNSPPPKVSMAAAGLIYSIPGLNISSAMTAASSTAPPPSSTISSFTPLTPTAEQGGSTGPSGSSQPPQLLSSLSLSASGVSPSPPTLPTTSSGVITAIPGLINASPVELLRLVESLREQVRVLKHKLNYAGVEAQRLVEAKEREMAGKIQQLKESMETLQGKLVTQATRIVSLEAEKGTLSNELEKTKTHLKRTTESLDHAQVRLDSELRLKAAATTQTEEHLQTIQQLKDAMTKQQQQADLDIIAARESGAASSEQAAMEKARLEWIGKVEALQQEIAETNTKLEQSESMVTQLAVLLDQKQQTVALAEEALAKADDTSKEAHEHMLRLIQKAEDERDEALSQLKESNDKAADEARTLALTEQRRRTAHVAWSVIRGHIRIRGLRKRVMVLKRVVKGLRRQVLERETSVDTQRRIAAERELERWKEQRRRQLMLDAQNKKKFRDQRLTLLTKLIEIVNRSERAAASSTTGNGTTSTVNQSNARTGHNATSSGQLARPIRLNDFGLGHAPHVTQSSPPAPQNPSRLRTYDDHARSALSGVEELGGSLGSGLLPFSSSSSSLSALRSGTNSDGSAIDPTISSLST